MKTTKKVGWFEWDRFLIANHLNEDLGLIFAEYYGPSFDHPNTKMIKITIEVIDEGSSNS